MSSSQYEIQKLREAYAKAIAEGHDADAEQLADRLGITPDQYASHIRARAMPGEDLGDRLHRFDDLSALPAGAFDPRVFEQADVWVDILRVPHRIASRDGFPDDYLLNVVAFLREEGYKWAATVSDRDWVLSAVFGAAVVATEVEAWLRSTPLFNALLGEIDARGLTLRDAAR